MPQHARMLVKLCYEKYQDIPLYKKLWQNSGITPILEKSDITNGFPHNFMTEAIKERLEQGDVEWTSSSGTTSDRMQIMRPAGHRQDQLNKTFEQHPLLKKCWETKMTRVALTTAVCSQTLCFKEDPGPAKRSIGRTLYINLSHDPQTWRTTDIERMLMEIGDQEKYFLDVDPYYLALFLLQLKKLNLGSMLKKPDAVTLGYELAPANIRRYIEDTLDMPAINIYGSTEFGYLLMDGNGDELKECSELTDIELLPLDADRHLYSLIVSTLKNPYMPLIRYRTGDCVEVMPNNNRAVIRICGREKENFHTIDEKPVPQAFVDDQIKACSPDLMLYQLQRLGEKKLQLSYTSFSGDHLSADAANTLQHRLSELLKTACVLQHRQSIAQALSGKFSWYKGDGNG